MATIDAPDGHPELAGHAHDPQAFPIRRRNTAVCHNSPFVFLPKVQRCLFGFRRNVWSAFCQFR